MKERKILPYLYAGRSVPEIAKSYAYDLLMTGEATNKMEAEKLLEYESMITDIDFLIMLRDWFNELYEIIDRRFPELLFLIEGRRKSLISVIGKIHNLLKPLRVNGDFNQEIEDNPLKRLKDLMAFRIILLDQSPEELIPMLYKIADVIIDFFTIKGFEPVEAEEPKGTGKFDASKHKEVFVPEKSLISSRNERYVKDYVISPKENGYQSIHIVFYDPLTGRNFEVQIRTFSMHVAAESGDADHIIYKLNTYDSIEEVDYSKINVRGFEAIPNFLQSRISQLIRNLNGLAEKMLKEDQAKFLEILEELTKLNIEANRGYMDNAGIFDSISILKRQKTFAHLKKNDITITT